MNERQKIIITPEEYNRITYELTWDDFNTSCPNPYRIDKLHRGIKKYEAYKRTQMRRRQNNS